ncbi:MAG: hypothetical protein ABI629_02885 [bacterium]
MLMNSCVAKWMVAVAHVAIFATGLLGVAGAAVGQTPAVTAVAPTAMPQSAPPTVVPRLPGGAAKAVGSGFVSTSQAACEKYIRVLSGKSADAALLKDKAVLALAQAVPDLPTCGAVTADSEALCGTLPASPGGGDKKDGDLRQSCRKSWAQFHELRKAPGRPFVTVVELEECRASKEMAPSCDAIAEAFRSGNPNKCPGGAFQSMCQAAVSLDPSFCRGSGPKADEQIKRCQQHIEEDRMRTKGLKVIAESGQGLDQQFAKAALGEADACAEQSAIAMTACTSGATASAAKEPAAKTPAPQEPAASKP